jgi:hypothetical protein
MQNHNSVLGIWEHPFFIWSLIWGFSNCWLWVLSTQTILLLQ